jgi:SOS-response transcriptional repressor LexA
VYIRPEQSVSALRGHVIVARLNGDFFIRRLVGPDEALVLASEDNQYSPIEI